MLDLLFVSTKEGRNTSGDFNLSHVADVLSLLQAQEFDCQVAYSPTHPIPARAYLHTNCIAQSDYPWMKQYGLTIYHPHGAGLFKNYWADRPQHRLHDILLLPGSGFIEKYEATHPGLLATKTWSITGYTKYDTYLNQLRTGTARARLVQRYGLDPSRPIVIYAPTWGPPAPIQRILCSHIPNLILALRPGGLIPADHPYHTEAVDKSLEIAGGDLVITDVSALGTEARKLGKPIIQLAIQTHEYTHQTHPQDLIIPELAHHGPYVIGQLVTPQDPFLSPVYWEEKISLTLSKEPPPGAQAWADRTLAHQDNQNSARAAQIIAKVIQGKIKPGTGEHKC